METLRDLLKAAEHGSAYGMKSLALPVELRRKLLGEFLELDQIRAAVLGHYDMKTGEWAIRTATRRRFIITTKD